MLVFHVDSINPDGVVIGRNDHVDIPIGTTFSNIRLCRIHIIKGEYQTEHLGNIASVSLTLQEVYFYRRSIKFIPGGHTAGLRFDGEGLLELANQLLALQPGYRVSLTASPMNTAEIR